MRGAKRRSNPDYLRSDSLDCFASLAMTSGHTFAFSRLDARVMRQRRPSKMEGAGNAGCWPHPWPACNKKAGGSHHRFSRNNRHSLRDGLRLIRDLPGVPGLLAPVAHGPPPANLTPASGCRDHTTSPSASTPLASRHRHVHRIPNSHVRGDWPNAPPVESGCSKTIIHFRKTEGQYFDGGGLTTFLITRSDLPRRANHPHVIGLSPG